MPASGSVALDATLDFITQFDGTHGRVRTCIKEQRAAVAPVFRTGLALEPMAWMAPHSLRKFCAPLKSICVWVHVQGLPLSLSVVLDQQVIEAHCLTLAQHTVEERSLLRRLARENGMTTPTTPLGFTRRTVPKPYSSAELEALRVFSSTMTNQNRRTSLLTLLCLGAGCCLSRGNLRGVTASSVHLHGDRLFVRSPHRCSLVLPDYVERPGAVCALRPEGQLIGPHQRNVTSTVVAWTHQRVGIPALSAQRRPSSFLVHRGTHRQRCLLERVGLVVRHPQRRDVRGVLRVRNTRGFAVPPRQCDGIVSVSTSRLAQAEAAIDRSGIVAFVETLITTRTRGLGRPREIPVHTLFVALVMLGIGGRFHLSRVVEYLNDLPDFTKRRLGLERGGDITRRQVENLYGLVCEVLEGPGPSATRWDRFDQACTMLVSATVHDDALSARSIALDGTSIASWGTRRRRGSKKLGTKGGSTVQKEPDSAFKITDPDAAWRGKGIDKWKRPVFGDDLTAAVSVPEVDGGGVPLSAKSIRIRPANFKTLETALAVVSEVARIQGSLGDVLADREYTKSIDGKDFLLPVRALGGEPVFELTKN